MRYFILLAVFVSLMASSPAFAEDEDVATWRVGAFLDMIEGDELMTPGDYLECNGQEIPLDSKFDALREVYGKYVPNYPPKQMQVVVGMENENYLIATKNMRKYVRAVPYIPPAPRRVI